LPVNIAVNDSKHRSWVRIAAAVCSSLGCLGWLGTIPFLDACQQGEQLARFFAVFVNQMIFVGIGIPATTLLAVGFAFSNGNASRLGRFAKIVSCIGFAIAGIVSLWYLPTIL
jgi:ABC-type sugar transport system permease subunit